MHTLPKTLMKVSFVRLFCVYSLLSLFFTSGLEMTLKREAIAAPREIHVISGDNIRSRVIKAVRGAPSLTGLEIARIKPPRFASQRVPKEAKINLKIVGGLRGGRMPVEVSFLSRGQVLRKLRVFVEVDLYMTGWALKTTSAAGAQLTRDDLIEVKRPSRDFKRDAIQDPEQVVGAKLRRVVSANVPLREAWLSIPPLVKRGAIVDLTFSRGGISLSAQGEALGDGKKRDMIRVRNLNSKKIVTGRVIGINRVDVGR